MTARVQGPLSPDELRCRVVITVAEFAATWDMDERSVRRAIRAGEIQAQQFGNLWRIPTRPLLRQCGLDDLEENANVSGGSPGPETAAETQVPTNDTEPWTNYARSSTG